MADDVAESCQIPVDCQRPIFIFSATQRCGSTLLQRLLNSNPDVMIWGEHTGYINAVTWAYPHLLNWSQLKYHEYMKFLSDGYDNFLPNITPSYEEVIFAMKFHIWLLFGRPAIKLNKHIWGFKEVRYQADVAVFIQNLFPNARFIYLTRNIEDCLLSLKSWELSDSGWRREWTEHAIGTWVLNNDSFSRLGGNISNLVSLKYEDIMKTKPSVFCRQLEQSLGLPVFSLREDVFDKRLDGNRNQVKTELNDNDLSLISAPDVRRVSRSLGYD